MTILILVNTIIILMILVRMKMIDIEIREVRTFKGTLIGLDMWIYGKYVRIPIRNERKIELKEDIERLYELNQQARRQVLYAKFSWLQTNTEVEEFVKDYGKVDKDVVDELAVSFVSNK